MMDIKVGDTVLSCWGYSMTLYDFYEVVGITKKSVKLHMLQEQVLNDDPGNLKVKPVLKSYRGSEFTRRIIESGNNYYCNGPTSSELITLKAIDINADYREDHMD